MSAAFPPQKLFSGQALPARRSEAEQRSLERAAMPGPPGSAPHLAPCLRRARIVEVPTVNGIADRVALGAAGYLAALVGEFVCILHEDGDDWVYARTTRSSGWIKTSALAVGEEEEKETMEQAASDLESMYAADWDRVALSQLPPPSFARGPCSSHRRELQVFTFGLETYDKSLAQIVFERGGGKQAQVTDEELVQAFQRNELPLPCVIADTRMFHDPAASELRRHTGKHPEILWRMCNHRCFSDWFLHVRHGVYERFDRGEHLVCLALFCKSGRHRSVAAAEFAEHAAHKEGWSCDVVHLSKRAWKCKRDCRECGEASLKRDLRMAAKELAWATWSCPSRGREP